MDALAGTEKIFAGLAALLIGVLAVIALRADWKNDWSR